MKKTYVIVDIESNGPIPGDYSMTSLGAAVIKKGKIQDTFTINLLPISNKKDPSRESFICQNNAISAKEGMIRFKDWLNSLKAEKLVFVSDNNGFDWMFVCWYFWHFLKENPFGYYSENIQSLYRGLKKDMTIKISELRERDLLHNALEDASDNLKLFNYVTKKFKF